MKNLLFIIFFLSPLILNAQDVDYEGNLKAETDGIINANRGRIGFSHTWNDWNHTIYNNYHNIDGEGVWDGMKFNIFKGADFRIGSSKTSALFINELGNVGIGTKTVGVQTMLHVKEAGNSTGIWKGRIVASGDQNAVVMGERNGKAWFGAHNALLNQWSDLIMQTDGGNIGIGTENPSCKLDVNGTIHAREIKVDLNGADFVFEKDYKLMPLNELEKFVKEQKHLPEVAPAKEMKKNGADLGNLNSKLLQKMEEMTLYIIEQNKKNEQQNIKIKALEEKIEKLETASK